MTNDQSEDRMVNLGSTNHVHQWSILFPKWIWQVLRIVLSWFIGEIGPIGKFNSIKRGLKRFNFVEKEKSIRPETVLKKWFMTSSVSQNFRFNYISLVEIQHIHLDIPSKVNLGYLWPAKVICGQLMLSLRVGNIVVRSTTWLEIFTWSVRESCSIA